MSVPRKCHTCTCDEPCDAAERAAEADHHGDNHSPADRAGEADRAEARTYR